MPELPEVMRIARGLDRLIGQTIESIEIVSGRYVRHGSPPRFDGFVASLPKKIKSIRNVGKLLLISLDGGSHIASTMGMTGSWKLKKGNHTRITMRTSIGDLFFNDIRNFGTVRFVDERGLDRILSNIGPSVDTVDLEDFAARLRSRERTIAEALMDQSCVSGVGNYIKAEALFASGISPHRMVSCISEPEMKILHRQIKNIVKASFEGGGASMRTFTDANGNRGVFQERFAVYGRKVGDDGKEITAERTLDGRTTFWSKFVQR